MSDPQVLLEDLGRNIALVLALMLTFGIMRGLSHPRRLRLQQVLLGILFGLAAMASMAAPVRLAPGVIMDMRNVLVALAFIFEGPLAGVVAGVMALAFRISLWGTGVLPGALLIACAMIIGELGRRHLAAHRTLSPRLLLAMGLSLSAAALGLTLLLVLEMNPEKVFALQRQVTVPVLIGYPIGTLLVGTLLSYEQRRREAERALRRERDLLQRIAETSPVSLVVADRAGNITMLNKQAERVLGVQMTPAKPLRFNAPAWHITDYEGNPMPEHELPFSVVLRTSRPVEGLRHAIELDSRRVLLSVNAAPMFDERGQVDGMIAIVEDVTDRVQSERRIQESEQKFRTLFNSTSEAIFVVPFEGGGKAKFSEVNDVACRWLGQTRAELEKLTFADITESQSPEQLAILLEAARDRPVTLHTALRTSEGTTRPIEVVAHAVNLMGKPVVMMLARDLSERNALEEQVRQSQKMEAVGRLAGGVAHDFNNILGIIMLCSETLEQNPHSPLAQTFAHEIRMAADRGAALTRQLLAFGRKQVVVPETVKFSRAISDMLTLVRRVIPANVEIVTRFEDQEAFVRMDVAQLEQVVLNLVVNARDAMPKGGRIDVTTKRVTLDMGSAQRHGGVPGEHVVLEVRDTGEGMSKEVRERIFEPFFSTKREHGTGLGLSVCFSVVKQASGHIEVESELGRGAVFRVLLPTVEAQAPDSEKSSPHVARGTGHVLLVEDQPALRGLVRTFLTDEGYEVHDYASAEDALAYARADGQRIDLLLTDVVMPGMSGPELAQTVLTTRPECKVVYMSGYAADMMGRYGLVTDDLCLLQKPFSTEALGQIVRKALDQSARDGP